MKRITQKIKLAGMGLLGIIAAETGIMYHSKNTITAEEIIWQAQKGKIGLEKVIVGDNLYKAEEIREVVEELGINANHYAEGLPILNAKIQEEKGEEPWYESGTAWVPKADDVEKYFKEKREQGAFKYAINAIKENF